MVTRVDRKPIIYNTTLIRCWKPAIVSSHKALLARLVDCAKGHNIPKSAPRDVLEDYEDIEAAFRMFGTNDPAFDYLHGLDDLEDDESIRIARVCLGNEKSIRAAFRSAQMMEDIAKIQYSLFKDAAQVYYGTEAVYKLFAKVINGGVFKSNRPPNYASWCSETAKRVLLTQSPYLLIHPTAVHDMVLKMSMDVDKMNWSNWDIYKKLETMALKLFSRKNLLAHSYYYGFNRKGFEPSEFPLDDFEIPINEDLEGDYHVYILLGMKYYVFGDSVFVLGADDCINLSTMAQCYFRAGLYFSVSNAYKGYDHATATNLIKDIANHCCRMIDAGKNFSHTIRSMHILAQKDFNDSFEKEMGIDLGWEVRSENYIKEARELDPMGLVFHKRALDLAQDKTDELNTGFIYHVFVGDEMLVDDLRHKVSHMTDKVREADPTEWENFIRFCKAYLLSRFMTVNKRKPRCEGEVTLLNENWANRCIGGQFTMAPTAQWGKVWIAKEFSYTCFADTWHLEAQDVAYVVKDSKGLVDGKYRQDYRINSELLMAMTAGNVLDTCTGSTPSSARERICKGVSTGEVVLTTAPKAENAKPSWKKRVTFAADCEFRKMQAEFDRNCRKVMSFIRGPSLGVDQCILEKQFSDIAAATASGMQGGICSHDISAWSESMDRSRKFAFEKVLIDMLDKPEMINIKLDWSAIKGVVNKQGCKDIYEIDNGSFQGFDGSASTILHSMILLYCIESARRKAVITSEVKTNMATLIDDCVALMKGLVNQEKANNFWAHLKDTYLKLGFEVDDLKSIFSTIKAIYLSRRFLNGGEVPADLKVFIKAHSSYEDPLRCALDAPQDIMGALRGACDANGEVWFIYYCGVVTILAELAHVNKFLTSFPPAAAAIFALAPTMENGWGIPSILEWCTNDIVDKRAHFNAILECLAMHENTSERFKRGVEVYPRSVGQAIYAIKSQAWRLVSYSNIFTNPFDCIREGPLKPDMLKRNAVQDMLREIATAKPWTSLLAWNVSPTTDRVRGLLIDSGVLHAPTLAALVNCMPDNYRLSLVGKAVGSQSLLDCLPKGMRSILKRRVGKCSQEYFRYTLTIYQMTKEELSSSDFAALSYVERTKMEREEFYAANGVQMTDHTFPDPVATFTVTHEYTGSVISPNMSSLHIWDKTKDSASRVNHLISGKGIYVPRRSGRVWEITSEFAKGWDTVSQRIAMGLAVLARAEADGHSVEGLLAYFIKSWNEMSNITPRDTHLISIHGSIKRLDANPGSSTHPITCHRNILKGFNNKLKTAIDAIPVKCKDITGSTSNLHDSLAHETAMLAITVLQFSSLFYLGVIDHTLEHKVATRPDCVVPESVARMTTGEVYDLICNEIMDSEDEYGLLQSCPELAAEIAIPTMKASWVKMISALVDGDLETVEELRKEAASSDLNELLSVLNEVEVTYTSSVVVAAEPALRGQLSTGGTTKYAILPDEGPSRSKGDGYTLSVRTASSKFTRLLSASQPDHIASAVAIRSVVWSKLKTRGASTLGKILYMDPDMDLACIHECSTANFWRGVISEVNKFRKGRRLSELCMLGFKSLGVPDLHIKASDSIADVTQSVASFFGSHLRLAVSLVSDQVASIAGRSERDYTRPILEKVVTNNPSLVNAKMRKEHISKIIEHNLKNLTERIELILNSEEKHRGDRRACEVNRHGRLVELRCRKYVYMHLSINEDGSVLFKEAEHGSYIHTCALRVAKRLELEESIIPAAPKELEETIEFTSAVGDAFIEAHKYEESGWETESGILGARLAYDTVMRDSSAILKTKFAVSAAELAPFIHKKIRVTTAAEPESEVVMVEEEEEEDDIFAMFGGPALSLADAAKVTFVPGTLTKFQIPAWQALYTLLYSRVYEPEDVNKALGMDMSKEVSPSSLREAYLSDFTDDQITKHFPDVFGDYIREGVIFDEEWLNRDEADAYTTDELGRAPGAYLF